jgi:hypothetical protein
MPYYSEYFDIPCNLEYAALVRENTTSFVSLVSTMDLSTK